MALKVQVFDTDTGRQMIVDYAGGTTSDGTSSEVIAAGDPINFFDDSGTMKARKATAVDYAHRCMGYASTASAAPDDVIKVIYEMVATPATLNVNTDGDTFLATDGTLTATPPASIGNVVQKMGYKISATELRLSVYDAWEVA